MNTLLLKNNDFRKDVFRNIISLKKSEDLFDDINGGDETLSDLAIEIEGSVKSHIPHGLISRGFHYTTAITYPFETQPFMQSRYGDGSYAVWYGSIAIETSIYETVFHMMQRESGVEGLNEVIVQERAVYKVRCEALLVDLSEQHHIHPKLVSENYDYTQHIGRILNKQGHPGLLAPSARYDGINNVIFNEKVLSNPRIHCYFTYSFDPQKGVVHVTCSSGKKLKISRDYYISRQGKMDMLAPVE